MAFVLLKDEDGQDFICNTANIASITADAADVFITVQKGATVTTNRPYESTLQHKFRLSAERSTPEKAALQLADDIAKADHDGKNLDLRHRSPPPVVKPPYDPYAGW
ncbi:MAG: hypothetical protein ACAH80_12690 [Alphaproteobacteria bacterium]